MKGLEDKQRKRQTWKRNKDRKKTVTKCETKKEEVYVERETWKRNSERNRERDKESEREWRGKLSLRLSEVPPRVMIMKTFFRSSSLNICCKNSLHNNWFLLLIIEIKAIKGFRMED